MFIYVCQLKIYFRNVHTSTYPKFLNHPLTFLKKPVHFSGLTHLPSELRRYLGLQKHPATHTVGHVPGLGWAQVAGHWEPHCRYTSCLPHSSAGILKLKNVDKIIPDFFLLRNEYYLGLNEATSRKLSAQLGTRDTSSSRE